MIMKQKNKLGFAKFLSAIVLVIIFPAFAIGQTTGTGQIQLTPTVLAQTMPIEVCPYENVTLNPGMRGDEVKALQSMLAQDPTIYPQGMITGYYGPLTQEAVRRLQQRHGLPETGILDQNTRPVIFPCVTVRVTSPNGGEKWQIGGTYDITWEAEAPHIMRVMDRMMESRVVSPESPEKQNIVKPFFQHLSIDLIRYDDPQILVYPAPVYYHIGSAPLYGERKFSWKIPQDIAESNMYKIRITLWRDFPNPIRCMGMEICPMTPYPVRWQGSVWDESDNYFSITTEVHASPLPTPPADYYGKLRTIRAQLQQALESIQKAIAAIDALLGTLSSQ